MLHSVNCIYACISVCSTVAQLCNYIATFDWSSSSVRNQSVQRIIEVGVGGMRTGETANWQIKLLSKWNFNSIWMCRAAAAEYHWQLSPSVLLPLSLCLPCHLLLSCALLTKTCRWHRQRVEVEVVVVSSPLFYSVCPPFSSLLSVSVPSLLTFPLSLSLSAFPCVFLCHFADFFCFSQRSSSRHFV